MKKLINILSFISLLLGCQKSILTSPVEPKLLGVWQEVGYQHKIEIKDNTIEQLNGFPLVVGDEITYLKSGNVLRCRYSSFIIMEDTFNLEILKLSDKELKLKVTHYPLTYELNFFR